MKQIPKIDFMKPSKSYIVVQNEVDASDSDHHHFHNEDNERMKSTYSLQCVSIILLLALRESQIQHFMWGGLDQLIPSGTVLCPG